MHSPQVQSEGKAPRSVGTFRFAIGAGNLRLSSIWSMKANKCDLYVGVSSLMGSLKLSIHGAEDYRHCHIALTREYWERTSEMISPPMDNRDLAVWAMPPMPERGATEVASIWFPRNNQRRRAEKVTVTPKKAIRFFPPAPPDAAIRVRFLESLNPLPTLLPKIRLLGHPIANFGFDDGRHVALTVSVEQFDAALLKSVRRGEGPGTIFNREGAPQPGQTISDLSAITWTEPLDGCTVHIAELHCFKLRCN